MNAPARQAPDLEDRNAAAVLRARGFPVTGIQSLARDQNPFARPPSPGNAPSPPA